MKEKAAKKAEGERKAQIKMKKVNKSKNVVTKININKLKFFIKRLRLKLG